MIRKADNCSESQKPVSRYRSDQTTITLARMSEAAAAISRLRVACVALPQSDDAICDVEAALTALPSEYV
jgi:hypothetical protein